MLLWLSTTAGVLRACARRVATRHSACASCSWQFSGPACSASGAPDASVPRCSVCALLAVHRCAQSTVDSKPLRSTWIRFQATYAYTRQLTQRVHSSSVQALKWQTLAVTQTSWQRAVGEASLANLKPRRRRGAPGGVTAVQVAPRLAVHTQAVQHASAHRRYESRNSDAVTHAVPAALNNRFTGARMRARSSGFVLMNAGTHAHSCAGHQQGALQA